MGCASDDASTAPPETFDDDLFPIEDANTVRMGAPDNAMLPFEGKADEVLPARFDLVNTQSPVKSQGRRGVCSIFGTVAYMEHLYILEGTLPNPDFSEQFLQWSSKIENGSFPSTSGSNSRSNLETLRRFGTVVEADWPYESNKWTETDDPSCDGADGQPTICYTNGEPPDAARMAQRWFVPSGGRWINSSARSLKSHMSSTGTAVQVGGDFFYQAWGHGGSRIPRYAEYRDSGYVVNPNQADIDSSNEHRAGHSFLLVGWDDELEVQAIDENGELAVDESGAPIMQRGFFLFKNSWGTGWAESNPFGAGYGWISYDYVEDHMSAYIAGVPELQLEEVCGDERDNDFNGMVDCADAACAEDRACIDPSNSYLNTVGMPIPDNDDTGLSSTIEVTEDGPVSGLSVSVDVTHSYRGDLQVTLSKDGTMVTLFENEGASADDLVRSFDVSDFDGAEAAGTWTLTVTDTASADTGTLNSWGLTITTCAGGDCDSMPTMLSGADDAMAPIPDDESATLSREIVISESGTIGTARVSVDIAHPFLPELTISLQKDGGEPIVLLSEAFIEGNSLVRTFTVDSLSGVEASGMYTLTVFDSVAGDQGTLNRWSVEILTE